MVVENTGDTSHTFWVDFSAENPGGAWSLGEGRYVELAPGERRTVTLSWTVPDGAQTGTYTAGAAVYESDSKDNRLGGDEESDAFRVERPTTEAWIADFSVDGGTYYPGDEVTGTVTVENTGDVSHAFWVDFSGQGPDGGWSTGEGQYVDLDPGERRTVDLTWSIPEGAEAGLYDGGTAVYKTDDKDTKYDGRSELDAFRVEQPTTEAWIADFSVESGTYQPGDTVTGTVTVENTGDLSHAFWVDFSGQGPDGGWSTGEGQYVDLDPGERRTVELTWTIPEDAETGTYDGGTAVYRSDSKDEKYDGRSELDAFQVERPTTEAWIADFSVDGGTYYPGDEVTGTVTVENTGDVSHAFWVDFSGQGPDGGWSTGEGQYVDLDPGERRTVDLTWSIPEGAEAGLYDGGTAVYKTDGKDTKYDGRSKLDAFRVEQRTAEAAITDLSVASGTYQPGETVTGTVTVENTGDLSHAFWVDFSGQGPDGGWSTGEGQYVDLDPGERRTVDLTWSIPEGAEAGLYDGGTAVFRSESKDEKYDGRSELGAFRVERPTTEATITDFSVDGGTYYPGDEITGTVTVENTGDVAHAFWVDFSGQGPDGGWSTGEGQYVDLDPGERRTVDLTWTVPDGAEEGRYDGGAAVFRSESKDEKYDGRSELDAFRVERPTVDATVADFTVDDGTYRPGETVTGTVTVENTGGLAHRYWVDYSVRAPDGDWTVADGQWVDLDPGERRAVELTWVVPEGARNGTYDAGTAVYETDDKDEKYDGVSDADAISVSIPTTDAAVTSVEPVTRRHERGDSATAAVTVENTGETTHSFWVDASVQSPAGAWTTGQGRRVTLDPGDRRTVELDAPIPADGSAGAYSLGAAVYRSEEKAEEYGGATRTDVLKVGSAMATVREVAPGRDEYQAGDLVTIDATVENDAAFAENYTVTTTIYQIGDRSDPVAEREREVRVASGRTATATAEWETTAGETRGSFDVVVSVRRAGSSERLDETTASDAVRIIPDEALIDVGGIQIDRSEVEPGGTVPVEPTVASEDDEMRLVTVAFEIRNPDGAWETVETRHDVAVSADSEKPLSVNLPVPADADPAEYDLRLTVHGSDATKKRYERRVVRDAFDVVGDGAVAVVVERPGGEAVPMARVDVNTYDGVSKRVGDDGAARFEGLPGGRTVVTVTSEEVAGPQIRRSKVIRYEAGTDREVGFTLGEEAAVSGTVHLPNGTKLEGLTVEIGEQSAETDADGAYNMDGPLATGHGTAVVKLDGDILHRQPVYLSEGDNEVPIRLPDTDPSEDSSSFLRGAMCGKWCWPDEVDDKTAYMTGWIASGFAAAGDVRDLPAAILDGDAVDTALTAFGLLPVVGDTGTVMKRLRQFSKVAKHEEIVKMQRVVAHMKQLDSARVKAFDALYDASPASTLVDDYGFAERTVKRLGAEGTDLGRARKSAKALTDNHGFARRTIRDHVNRGGSLSRLEDAAESARFAKNSEFVNNVEKAGDLAEAATARRLLQRYDDAAMIKHVDDISDDGYYVMQGVDGDNIGDIDAVVLRRTDGETEVEAIYEVTRASDPFDKEGIRQLQERLGKLETGSASPAGIEPKHVPDDVDTVYQIPSNAADVTNRAGQTIFEYATARGHSVKTFGQSSDAFVRQTNSLAKSEGRTPPHDAVKSHGLPPGLHAAPIGTASLAHSPAALGPSASGSTPSIRAVPAGAP
ncbi:NEW3 domain-containing protein [Halosimplex sp. J119]